MEHEVTRAVIAALQEAARIAFPDECCGILTGQGIVITGAVAAANVHPAPETHFEIDPAALIAAHKKARDDGPEVLGYYHSHPSGEAIPSPTDAAMSARDGSIWAIIGNDSIRLWRDTPGGFEPLPYAIADS